MHLPRKFAEPARCGFSLIEVVAALILTATLLVSTFVAFGRTLRQQQQVSERMAALELAETLLADWAAAGAFDQKIPKGYQFVTGEIQDRPEWNWMLSRREPITMRGPYAERFQLETYRLEIRNPAKPEPNQILLSVDLSARWAPIVISGKENP